MSFLNAVFWKRYRNVYWPSLLWRSLQHMQEEGPAASLFAFLIVKYSLPFPYNASATKGDTLNVKRIGPISKVGLRTRPTLLQGWCHFPTIHFCCIDELNHREHVRRSLSFSNVQHRLSVYLSTWIKIQIQCVVAFNDFTWSSRVS